MSKLLTFIKKNYNWIVFVLFLLLSLILTLNHITWRDEAQNYMIVRDNSLFELFNCLKYEGHPILWYLILKIFVSLGCSYRLITLLPWIITSISAFILTKNGKLYIALFFILFSPVFLYYSAVYVRSYTLITLLMVLLMTIYKNRFSHPFIYGLLLLLLINTHILMAGFVGALLLIDLIEIIKNKNKRLIISILIAIIGIIIVYITLKGSTDVSTRGISTNLLDLKYIFPILYNYFYYYTFLHFFAVISLISFIVYLIYLIYKKEYSNIFVLLCGMLFPAFVSVFVRGISISIYLYQLSWHIVSIPWIILVFSMYNVIKKNEFNLFIIICCIFMPTISFTTQRVINEIKIGYSDSYNVANYIMENIESGSIIYTAEECRVSSVIGYLPKDEYTFVDYFNNTKFTYAMWNIYDTEKNVELLKENIIEVDGYVVGNAAYLPYYTKGRKYELLYITESSKITDEQYFVIKLK